MYVKTAHMWTIDHGNKRQKKVFDFYEPLAARKMPDNDTCHYYRLSPPVVATSLVVP